MTFDTCTLRALVKRDELNLDKSRSGLLDILANLCYLLRHSTKRRECHKSSRKPKAVSTSQSKMTYVVKDSSIDKLLACGVIKMSSKLRMGLSYNATDSVLSERSWKIQQLAMV